MTHRATCAFHVPKILRIVRKPHRHLAGFGFIADTSGEIDQYAGHPKSPAQALVRSNIHAPTASGKRTLQARRERDQLARARRAACGCQMTHGFHSQHSLFTRLNPVDPRRKPTPLRSGTLRAKSR
jgi:hypothetical protein